MIKSCFIRNSGAGTMHSRLPYESVSRRTSLQSWPRAEFTQRPDQKDSQCSRVPGTQRPTASQVCKHVRRTQFIGALFTEKGETLTQGEEMHIWPQGSTPKWMSVTSFSSVNVQEHEVETGPNDSKCIAIRGGTEVRCQCQHLHRPTYLGYERSGKERGSCRLRRESR